MAFGRILIAVDDTDVASHALTVGIELARAMSAKLALVHAVDVSAGNASDDPILVMEISRDGERDGRELLDALASRVGDDAETFLVRGDPSTAIVATADRWKADAIVLGTHRRTGFARMMLGSVAEGAMRAAHCPVLVVPAA